jgi:acyl-CoA oxidase
MFLGACKNIADDEQAAKWLPNITALRMTGCYA